MGPFWIRLAGVCIFGIFSWIIVMSEEQAIKIETAPFDARFPYTNQTKNCWQNYVDFHRCSKKLSEEHETCTFFKKSFKSLCPSGWVQEWDERVKTEILLEKFERPVFIQ